MKPENDRSRFPMLMVGLALAAVFIGLPVIFLYVWGGGYSQSGNVAVIPIEGIIMSSGRSGWGEKLAVSDGIVKFLRDANEDKAIKAVVLEINSPGGSAVASDVVGNAVKEMNKPVVAIIKEVGASGGYWIASSSEYIVANRMSVTGSIGVVSSYLEFSGLMDRYGVGYERLVAGERKDMGSPFRALEIEEKEILDRKLRRIHYFFIEEVAANRKMEISKVRELATGEFYLGVEAQELGLIDELGGMKEVEGYLKQKYNLSDISYVRYEVKPGLLDMLLNVKSGFSRLSEQTLFMNSEAAQYSYLRDWRIDEYSIRLR